MQTILKTSSLKDTVRARPGTWMSFRLTASETNSALSIIDVRITPGSEPPRHIHQREDETLIIHSGTVTFFVGDEIINAKAGDIVFMPRKVPHHFAVTSAKAHATLIATPGGIENFFEEITFPFDEQTIPATEKPSADEVERLFVSAEKFGMQFV